MADELHFSTIAQTAELIRTRKLSPVELAQTYLKRIAELDSQLNAFITVTAELALEQALIFRFPGLGLSPRCVMRSSWTSMKAPPRPCAISLNAWHQVSATATFQVRSLPRM